MRNDSKKRPALRKVEAAGDSTVRSDTPIIVVGLGTPAGSQKSLQKFFSKMPTGRGVAFVLVRHIRRSQKDLLVKTIKKQTPFTVVEAKDGMPVLADRIHVIPPDKFLNITGGSLTLQEPVLCNGLRMPIDHFFCSLAVDQRRNSIGVLLSGRGSDGTLGLSEIKAAGGRTLVEDPGRVTYANMSQSAIAAGVADTVLPAEAMADALISLVERVITETRSAAAPSDIDANVRAILDILRARIGHDFRCYKPGTLVRRINRRTGLAKLTSLEDYVKFLQEHPEEIGLLQKDLLIGVTDFFRQPHAWEMLMEKVISSLVENTQPGSEIRAWVPGCSTGKEAYSLAMLLTEEIERSGKKVTVQIFATDSHVTALAIARSGIYSKEDMGQNLSPVRLRRFFLRKDGHYQVVKDIREQIVFAPQNITADPPFSRLDLISCRNLLIYLEQEVQKKVIDLFHFSLREGGFLFLGTAETVGDRENLFEPVSKKWHIYRRIGVGHRIGVEIPVRISAEADRGAAKLPVVTPPSRMSLTSGAQYMLLDRFVPACVMIDRKLQVLYVHGRVDDYITFPPGELTTRIVDMAREGLRARLRGAIVKCLESNKSVSVTARVRRGEKSVPVKTVASPLRYPREIDGLLLITFEDYLVPVAKSGRKMAEASDTQQLLDELKITREELQSTIEQLENSNDEMKASNEEVTATNEELQSANEELETSKEELQSLNEELNTINTRLQEKVDELENINNDVVNLLASTNIATVFLDKGLHIKRFTPAVINLFFLISSDIGRHIGEVLHRFSDDALVKDANRVLENLAPLSAEVQADNGRWYIRSITPYRTQDDRIEGVVITFMDVADLKRAEETLRQSEQRYRTVADYTYDWEFWIGPEGRFNYVSPSVERMTGRQVAPNDRAEDFFRQIVPPEDLGKRLEHLREEMAGHGPGELEYRILRPDGEVRWIHHVCQPIHDAEGRFLGQRGSNRDITERKQAEEAFRQSQKTFFELVERSPFGTYVVDSQFRIAHMNASSQTGAFRNVRPLIGRDFAEAMRILWPEPVAAEIIAAFRRTLETGEPYYSPRFINPRADAGITESYEWELHRMTLPDGQYGVICYYFDSTALRNAEAAARESEGLLRRQSELLEYAPVLVRNLDDEIILWNSGAESMYGYSHDEAIGKVSHDLLKTGEPRPTAEMVIRHEGQWEGELRHKRKDGSDIIVKSLQVLHRDIDGNPAAVIEVNADITARKQAEEALRERERLLQDVIDGSTSPIFLKDRDGRFITINAALEKMLGKSREEMKGKTDYDISPKEIADYWREHDKEVMALGKGVQIEEVADLKDGHHIFLANKFPLVDAHGQIYGVGAISHDITERKRTEQELQTTMQRLQTLVAGLHSSILFVGEEGRIVFANQAFCDYFRLLDSPQDLMGITAREMIDKVKNAYLNPEEQVARIMEIVRKGQPVIGEEITMQDGRSCLRDFIPVQTDGRSYGLLWQHTDITERMRADEALRENEALLRALTDGSPDAIYVKDAESRWLMANPAVLRIVGKTAEDALGKTDIELYEDPEIGRVILENDRRILERGESEVIEEVADTPDGRRTFLSIKAPRRDSQGNIIGIVGISHDITERKEKEAQISKLTRLYAALSRVNEAIVRVRDEASLYDEVCQILSEEGNFPLVWVGQVEGKQVIPAAWYGSASGYLKEIKVETEGRLGQGPTGTSIRENRSVINDDFATSPVLSPWRETAIRFGFSSSAAFPLVRGGKAVASLTLYSPVAGTFDTEQVRLLESLSADISYALDALSQERLRRTADEAVRGSEERFRLLSSTAARLLRADDPQAIVEDLCRDIMKYLDCQAFFNFLVDDKAGRLRLNACAGIPEEEARAIEWLDYGVAVCGCVAQARQRIIAEDILHTPDVRTDLVKSFGIQAYCCHPLMAQDSLMGTLSFGTKTRARFSAEEVELMRIVTDQVAVAMQRKQAEEALTILNQELEQRVSERTAEVRDASLYSRRLIEASLDPLVTISPEGKIMDVNEATEKVTGWSRQKLIGSDFSDYFTEPNAAQAGYKKVLTDGQVRDYPLTILNASGKTTNVLYNATVYRNARGEVQGVFAAARDVTEAKRIEAELARHREHLEDMVKERTAELEAANRELESFSYSVSHDLRAPLRAIDGYARMILKKEGDKFDEETLRKFNVIRSSAQTMGQLIDDILSLSRVVKKHLSTSQLEMDAIIKDVWKEQETINPERKMELTVRDIPVSHGDRTLIKQVYANLLSNAVKFTKDRDPAIIETGGYVQGNENIYYIRDNGVGFDMKYYDKLYGIFQRLHGAEEFEGTGVGLATVQRIVHRHGGRVWAEGKVNEGATFYFSLPQKR